MTTEAEPLITSTDAFAQEVAGLVLAVVELEIQETARALLIVGRKKQLAGFLLGVTKTSLDAARERLGLPPSTAAAAPQREQ